MGWVTLTLRKTELKRSHSDYQMELLQISRQKRQMARQNHYDQLVQRNSGQNELNSLYADYRAAREAANQKMDGATTTQTNADGSTSRTTDQSVYDEAQRELNAAKEDYEMKKMNAQNDMEEELQRIEEEANEIETQLDQEQVEVEAQLEAISQEIEAVGQAISSQIQASTIKLS